MKDETKIVCEDDAVDCIKQRCFTNDQERNHIDADEVVVKFLTFLGYTRLVKIYKKVEKWYA